MNNEHVITVGDVVLFVLRIKGWSSREYMIGTVVAIAGDMVSIVDIVGEQHAEYQRFVQRYYSSTT